MHHIQIKPISVNALYRNVQGVGRVKTNMYKQFYRDAYLLLPMIDVPEGRFGMRFIFGVSSSRSDLDNLVKAIVDVMQDKWNFDDKLIWHYDLYKKLVPKGSEYIEFEVLCDGLEKPLEDK